MSRAKSTFPALAQGGCGRQQGQDYSHRPAMGRSIRVSRHYPGRDLLPGGEVRDQVAHLLVGQPVDQAVRHDRALAPAVDLGHVAGQHLEPVPLLVHVVPTRPGACGRAARCSDRPSTVSILPRLVVRGDDRASAGGSTRRSTAARSGRRGSGPGRRPPRGHRPGGTSQHVGQLRVLEHAAAGLRVGRAVEPLEPGVRVGRRRPVRVERLAEDAGREVGEVRPSPGRRFELRRAARPSASPDQGRGAPRRANGGIRPGGQREQEVGVRAERRERDQGLRPDGGRLLRRRRRVPRTAAAAFGSARSFRARSTSTRSAGSSSVSSSISDSRLQLRVRRRDGPERHHAGAAAARPVVRAGRGSTSASAVLAHRLVVEPGERRREREEPPRVERPGPSSPRRSAAGTRSASRPPPTSRPGAARPGRGRSRNSGRTRAASAAPVARQASSDTGPLLRVRQRLRGRSAEHSGGAGPAAGSRRAAGTGPGRASSSGERRDRHRSPVSPAIASARTLGGLSPRPRMRRRPPRGRPAPAPPSPAGRVRCPSGDRRAGRSSRRPRRSAPSAPPPARARPSTSSCSRRNARPVCVLRQRPGRRLAGRAVRAAAAPAFGSAGRGGRLRVLPPDVPDRPLAVQLVALRHPVADEQRAVRGDRQARRAEVLAALHERLPLRGERSPRSA